MKKIIISLLACYTPFIVNATEIVTPDIELGNWVTTSDISAFIDQALAAVPESTRPMIRKMMEEKMESTNNSNQCITKETLTNFDKQLQSAFGDNQDCKFAVAESSKAKLVASMTCPGSVIKIETLFVNDKLSTSSVVTSVQGMPETTLNMTSKWTSSDCPKGV
ncbi:DUF3617 domain-containing protein [Pseudocolwellia sp. HL-MZ19]|uniref:DUF3617 domain-containing protein n=1 Tax=unclassified Pseudocolwellia TaxID=2848178 RepID=UPI003CFBA19D